MRRVTLLALPLILAAVAPPHKAARRPAPAAPASPAAETRLIQSCDAHKFETVVDTMVDGQPHKSKVKLCGVEGQSDAEWIGTLKDAIRKLDANGTMAKATRDQIVAAINAEIGRLTILGTPVPATRESQPSGTPSLSRDYAALPPIPAAPEAPASAPPPVVAVPAPAVATPAPAIAQAAPVPPVAVPALRINCEDTSEFAGPAPCAAFGRDTRLTISADGEVPAGTMLQFIRNGREQAAISLDGIRKGTSLGIGLPAAVCAGFGAGRLELRVMPPAGSAPAQSEGPFSLSC